MTQLIDPSVVHSVSDLIKLSVAPVFLLAAVAGLLNVFIGRLARIMDKLDRPEMNTDLTPEIISRRKFLTMRMSNINLAIFFCTTTGLLISLVILTMFLSTMFHFSTSLVISILFVLAMSSLIVALLVFLKEIHYTTSFIRTQRILAKEIEK